MSTGTTPPGLRSGVTLGGTQTASGQQRRITSEGIDTVTSLRPDSSSSS